LSTVSGGSIVGASYALGIPPHAFAKHLLKHPGLGNDLNTAHAAILEWLSPWASSADAYAAHFQRVFFGDRRLNSLRDEPLLLINTTDLERHEPHVREVLFKGRSRAADETLVGEAVAASGAFPGAFEPKRLRWPEYVAPLSGDPPLTQRTFVDGGVVDNLGLEGLSRYLSLRLYNNDPAPLPVLVIISDASQYPVGTNFPTTKVGPLTSLTRALNMSWAALHRYMYSRATGFDAFGVPGMIGWARATAVFGGLPRLENEVLTVMLPTANPMSQVIVRGCTFAKPGDWRRIAEDVSEYETLAELDPEGVLKAYWVGYMVGRRYAPVLDALRTHFIERPANRDELNRVAELVLRGTGPCVSRAEILRTLDIAAEPAR
jgi:hypothetical protein